MDHSENLTPEEQRRVEEQAQAEKAAWWAYDQLPSGAPYDWSPATRGDSEWDKIDFHLDLGCGTIPKARLGIDRHWAPGVGLIMDLESLTWQPVAEDAPDEAKNVAKRGYDLCRETSGSLPFPDESIESIVTHHCLEHLWAGFLPLMDECFRVLKPGGVMRIITPLFPSYSAVADPDHKRYIMEGTFQTFCGTPEGDHWHESFSVPYTDCRFEMVDEDISPPTAQDLQWTPDDAREIRVTLRKWSV